MIEEFIPRLRRVQTQQHFDDMHEDFCKRFMENIYLAKAVNEHASYGHAAKVLDVAMKACVDFCQLPDVITSKRIKPFLHAGIDTQILAALKKEAQPEVTASCIQEIDDKTYHMLQVAVAKQIRCVEKFHGLLPVEYETMRFLELNPRKKD